MTEAKRTYIEISDEKRAQVKLWQKQVAEELPELAQRLQLANEAADEQSFSGELRRAIHASGLNLNHIARQAGITPLLLDEFLTGERTLRSDIIDRLVALLNCSLCPRSAQDS